MKEENYFHLARLTKKQNHNAHGINAKSYNNFTYEHVRNCLSHIKNKSPNITPKILDCGCGWGGLGRVIRKNYPNVILNGIEQDEAMSSVAALFHDEVLPYSIEAYKSFEPVNEMIRSSDIIVLSDVFEHIYDPWKVYSDICNLMKPGSTLILSIPTITNAYSLAYLLREGFSYRASGIYDFTHQRFFAPTDILKLVSKLTLRKHTTTVTNNYCPESASMLNESQANPNMVLCCIDQDVTLQIKKNSEKHLQLLTRGLIVSVNIHE